MTIFRNLIKIKALKCFNDLPYYTDVLIFSCQVASVFLINFDHKNPF
jgi:hypothetical protein